MKMWNYVVLSTFLALLFELAGISVAGNLLSYVGISTDGSAVSNSLMYLAIFGVSGILIGLSGAIIIGVLTKSQSENYVVLPFVISGIILFASTFTGIITYAYGINTTVGSIVSLILSPLLVGFVISCIDYFRGID